MAAPSDNTHWRRLIRESIHAVLLRYARLLKSVYHSRAGQAILLSRPLAPLTQQLTKQLRAQVRVIRLPALLELGFTERAIADMEQIAAGSPSQGERLIAAWELSVHFATSDDPADIEKALEHLAFVLAKEKNEQRRQSAAVLKSECLDRLGRSGEAREFVETVFKRSDNSDLGFALANLYTHDPEKRLSLINNALGSNGLEPIALMNPAEGLVLDNLHVPACQAGEQADGPLVTVLMPAWNAEAHIATALNSLLAQSWQNLEILVVDDASTDNTAELVKTFARQDDRIRLIQSADNRGPYVARNLGLAEAHGKFVTVHDTDDWSHPRKIEKQVRHLLKHPEVMANLSKWARVMPDMVFHRRGNAGFYVAMNMSSLMFRREEVLDRAGYWDCVRFGGDSEHIRRLRTIFGKKAVVELQTGPLSLARQTESSLTGDNYFGYPGFFMGARRAYLEAGNWWHRETSEPYMPFPQDKRPFPIPSPMMPEREKQATASGHMDVIIATEFRLTGGTIASTIEEIKAQIAMGLQTGLFPLLRFDLDPDLPWNGNILELIDSENVHLLVYGETVSCDLLIIRHPPVLQEFQDYLPTIDAKNVVVIANQPPFRDYHDPDSRLYDVDICQHNVKRYFGLPATWLPIGPAVRNTLLEEPAIGTNVELGNEDWVNIIDVESWHRGPSRSGTRPVIGRHARDQYVKWPDSREALLAAYPADDTFEVRILGGADAAAGILGRIPRNWTVYPFGAMSPKEFLADIDVFVYFTHPGWVEAFGRSPLEAMAAGVPVIVPESFRPLFQDAAIYATPFDVQDIVMQLHNDSAWYQERSRIGRAFAQEYFSYEEHRRRLRDYIRNPGQEASD